MSDIYELPVHTNVYLCYYSLNDSVLYMRYVQPKPIQGRSWVKVLQQSDKNHNSQLDKSTKDAQLSQNLQTLPCAAA